MSQNLTSLGAILQKKRQELGLEISEVAKSLNIKAEVINGIENDQIDQLKLHKIYALGLVRSYGGFLKIDTKIIDKKIDSWQVKSNIENKSHILVNVGEDDKLTPSKNDVFNFFLIAILLFLIALSIYNLTILDNPISSSDIISKFEKIDGNKN